MSHHGRGRPEDLWQAKVIELAKLYGWRWYHTYDSRRSNAGFPDLTLVKGDRLVFAELKSPKGRVSREQREWLEALAATGAEVGLWRPEDLPTVIQILGPRGVRATLGDHWQ